MSNTEEHEPPKLRRVRTKSVTGTAKQVTGLVEIINGRPVNPGWWIIYGGKEGPVAVPPKDFERHFELLPEGSVLDPSGANELARTVCMERADEASGAATGDNIVLSKDELADMLFGTIERFMERGQGGDLAPDPDAAPDPAATNPGGPPPIAAGTPSDVTVAFDPEQDRVVVSFGRMLLGLRMEVEKARAFAMAIWESCKKSQAGKNGVHKRPPGGNAA